MALFRKSPAKNSAAAVLNKRRYPGLWKYVSVGTLALLCLTAGATFCLNFLRSTRVEGAALPTVATADVESGKADGETAASVATELLDFADEALLSGDLKAALEIYRNSDLELSTGTAVRYRMAICYETLGQLDEAIAVYRTITGSASDRGFSLAAKLGLVRVHMLAHEWELAESHLYEIILAGGAGDEPNGTAFHQLARIATESLPGFNLNSYESDGVLPPDWQLQVEDLLSIPVACSSPISLPFPEPDISVLSRIRNAPESIRISVKASEQNARQLVDRVLSETGLGVQWDSQGINASAISHVEFSDLDVATFLDALLNPNGLTWIVEGSNVRILALNEMQPDIRIERQLNRAERYCNNGLALFPEHKYAVRTYLSLGNIAFQTGDAERASNYYRQILRVARDSEVIGDTWFNQAKSLRKLGQLDEAVGAFTKVVDHASGRGIDAVAYLYLGEIALESGDTHTAVRNLVRAVTIAQSPDVRQLSVLTLASAYLMESNPLAANMTLMEHRELMKASPYHSNSWFLSSLARFRAATSPTEKFHRGRTLTSSLTEVFPERFFTTAEIVLLGQAYFEIGLPDEMQSVYETYLSDAEPNFVLHRAMFSLGESYMQGGATERGRELFNGMLDGEETAWSEKARLRLAEIDLAAGRTDECLAHCVHVVNRSPSRDSQSRALALMGKVYEGKDDHIKAALCFAGMMPHASTASLGDMRRGKEGTRER